MNRILIADDDRATLHLLSGVLKNAGYATEIAHDGHEAQADRSVPAAISA